MSQAKGFGLHTPEGTGLPASLGKGEKAFFRGLRDPGRNVFSLRVEAGRLAVPPELGKKPGLCYGNAFPARGGCPWAQGIIQCP